MSHRARGAARPDEQTPLIAHGVGSSLLYQTPDEPVAVHISSYHRPFVEADDVAASYRSGRRREMRTGF
jgi:hypothetical protein